MNLKELLFPKNPRTLAGRRWIKIILRAIHVVFAAGFLGAYVFGVEAETRTPWTIGIALSGLVLLTLDLLESGAFLAQVRGVVVLCKVLVLAALPWLGPLQPWALGALMVISVLSSHAPGSVRYRMLWGGDRIKGADSSG